MQLFGDAHITVPSPDTLFQLAQVFYSKQNLLPKNIPSKTNTILTMLSNLQYSKRQQTNKVPSDFLKRVNLLVTRTQPVPNALMDLFLMEKDFLDV